MLENHEVLARLEDLFEAAKRLLVNSDVIAERPALLDFLRIADKYELEPQTAINIYEIFFPGAGLHFQSSVDAFQPYSEKERRGGFESGGDILDLSNNENLLGPSPRVVSMLRDNLNHLGSYPPLSDLRLRQQLATFLAAQGLREDHLVLGRGANDLISEIAYAFLAEGNYVAICDHTFPVYREMAERSGCFVLPLPLKDDHSYDINSICLALERKPRIIFLASPNNPTGAILEAEEFLYILDRMPSGTLLVLDECYRDFAAEDANLPDTFTAITSGRDVISLRSFSKAHGLSFPRFCGHLERSG